MAITNYLKRAKSNKKKGKVFNFDEERIYEKDMGPIEVSIVCLRLLFQNKMNDILLNRLCLDLWSWMSQLQTIVTQLSQQKSWFLQKIQVIKKDTYQGEFFPYSLKVFLFVKYCEYWRNSQVCNRIKEEKFWETRKGSGQKSQLLSMIQISWYI